MRTMRHRVVCASALLVAVAFAAPASGSSQRAPTLVLSSSVTHPRPASTVVVVKDATLGGYAFAEGKLAWFPISCRSAFHSLNLPTGHREGTGRCDDLDRRELAIGGGSIFWLTFSAGNTSSVENVYSASRGRTRLLAHYDDDGCEDPPFSCGADVFASDGHAFVFHEGTIFRIAGSKLQTVLSSPGSRFGAA